MLPDIKVYIAEVTETDKRKIKARSDILSPEAGWILPLSWGHLKVPVPEVGDHVWVFVADAMNRNRYYLPLPSLEEADSDSEESLMLLGKQAVEPAVLGDTLQAKLEAILDAIMAQTHSTMFGPTGPPLNVATYIQIKALIGEICSLLVKVQ